MMQYPAGTFAKIYFLLERLRDSLKGHSNAMKCVCRVIHSAKEKLERNLVTLERRPFSPFHLQSCIASSFTFYVEYSTDNLFYQILE